MEYKCYFVLNDPVRKEKMRFLKKFDLFREAKAYIEKNKNDSNFALYKIIKFESDRWSNNVKETEKIISWRE